MATNYYHYLSTGLSNPATTQGAVFYAIVIFILAWVIGQSAHLASQKYLSRAEKAGIDSTSIRFLSQLIKIIVYLAAFVIYFHLIPAFQPLGTAWLASLGVVSVIIGLATQSTLSNLVAGISLILYRPFRVGERIQVTTPAGPEIGVVESIDLGYTSIVAPDGRRILLPNSQITNQTHINFSRNLPRVLLEINVTALKGQDIAAMRGILLEAAKTTPKISKINGCFVTGLGSQGIPLMLSAMCLDPGNIAEIKSDVLEKAQKQFDAAGIKVV